MNTSCINEKRFSGASLLSHLVLGVILALALMFSATVAVMATSDYAHAAKSQKTQKVKWMNKLSNIYCKVDGKTQKGGVKVINGKKYLFAKNGMQLTGWRKLRGGYYYFKPKPKADGSMVTSKVVNGIKLDKNGRAKLNKGARAELNVMLRATKYVDRHTRLGWSEYRKLRSCFNYLRDKYREVLLHRFTSKYGWARLHALDIFVRKAGSCHSCAAAFAYMANAIGCKNCKVVSSGGHSWAEVNGKVYDAEWSRHSKHDLFAIDYSRSGKNGIQAYKSCRYYIVTLNPRTKVLTR